MKNKTRLILLAITVILLLLCSGNVTSGYFSDGESSTNNILRVKDAPLLGSADNFAILAGSAITNTGTSAIIGDVGSSPTAAVSGLTSGMVKGMLYTTSDIIVDTAKTDLVTAYEDAAGRTATATVDTELGGTDPAPGIYNSAAGKFGITGTLTLTGDANAVWIFQAASTLITADNSQVILTGGAKAYNVYWQVGSSATLGTNSSLKGNILALTSITLNTGATLEGRALARNGAVTLVSNTVTKQPAP